MTFNIDSNIKRYPRIIRTFGNFVNEMYVTLEDGLAPIIDRFLCKFSVSFINSSGENDLGG